MKKWEYQRYRKRWTEYKLPQNADDTYLISNVPPDFESMDGILIILDYFADVSRLNINYTKTFFALKVKIFSRWILTIQDEN